MEYAYLLLGRLRQDCDFYLGYGGRNAKILWAGEESDHIKKMKINLILVDRRTILMI